MNFSVIFCEFLKNQDLTVRKFAEKSKISESKVKRWARGVSVPQKSEIAKLRKLGLTNLDFLEEQRQSKVPAVGKRANTIEVDGHRLSVAPYVANGPDTQAGFFEYLIKLQLSGLKNLSCDEKIKRLALIQADENGNRTIQDLLERPKATVKHWNSNYSTHGFHRYVGRFPPHIVRALINSFELAPGALVLDPFLGSGTTLVEARLMGMRAIGVELCPLSAMISRVKSRFPDSTDALKDLAEKYETFFKKTWSKDKKTLRSHKAILARKGNLIEAFPNVEKWFTPQALLGVSITVEFANQLKGYPREFMACALSSSMRSIGNLDVDVVRAEYSKNPRLNVDVLKLVQGKLNKFVKNIDETLKHSEGFRSDLSAIKVLQGSSLEAKIEANSIDAIITSPPYGVEALSYLRTHLLSYRSLNHFLDYDPYSDSSKIVGSEYLPKKTSELWSCSQWSKTFSQFFKKLFADNLEAKHVPRAHMMMKFFDDMALAAQKYVTWLKPGGKIAFVVGNKKIGERVIPTEQIIKEIFENHGLAFVSDIKHKLKTNNSNSEVPWQENIIQDEFILIFQKA